MTLTVPDDLIGDAFEKARHEAFLNAVKAWNEVDKSARRRIPAQIPEHISVPDQPGMARPPLFRIGQAPDSDISSPVDYFAGLGSDSEEKSSHP